MERAFSVAPWEQKVGYCRAVKAGNHIYVSGTAAVDAAGHVFGAANPYAQAKRCIEIIEQSLQQLGAELRHVVRTRIYVTDISQWEDIGRAHFEAFGEFPPATTMVEVKGLINPRLLVEIEAEAVLS